MVYIYKKTIGNKDYYYLRVSERKGKKVISKDIAYLGNDIKKVKKNLDKLSSYKNEIRKAHHTLKNFIDSNYYLDKAKNKKLKKNPFLEDKQLFVEACRIHFKEKFLKLNKFTQKDILENFLIDFAFNTTSIEGNTISLKQAQNLLQQGKTPKDKTLREIYDLQNTQKVFFELFNNNFNRELSHNFIIEIHDKLLENIDKRQGYRKTDVRVLKSNFDPTPAEYIKTDIEILLKWFNKNKKILHPLVLSTIFHHKFEKIHPFYDGNGRTGRMLMNYILMKNKFPPIIIQKKFRKEYLDFMRIADESSLNSSNKENYKRLIQFNAEELTNSYWRLFLF